MHRSKPHHYSIASSARASSVGGTSRPRRLGRVEIDNELKLDW